MNNSILIRRDALSLHVTLQLCNQLNTINKKPGKEFFANVSLVSDKSTEDPLNEGLVPERLPVIHIARRDHEVQEVSLFVANEVQFEAIEPSHRALAPLGKSLENPVEMDALVLADAQSRTSILSTSSFVKKDGTRSGCLTRNDSKNWLKSRSRSPSSFQNLNSTRNADTMFTLLVGWARTKDTI